MENKIDKLYHPHRRIHKEYKLVVKDENAMIFGVNLLFSQPNKTQAY